jgi:hypothetical protein
MERPDLEALCRLRPDDGQLFRHLLLREEFRNPLSELIRHCERYGDFSTVTAIAPMLSDDSTNAP